MNYIFNDCDTDKNYIILWVLKNKCCRHTQNHNLEVGDKEITRVNITPYWTLRICQTIHCFFFVVIFIVYTTFTVCKNTLQIFHVIFIKNSVFIKAVKKSLLWKFEPMLVKVSKWKVCIVWPTLLMILLTTSKLLSIYQAVYNRHKNKMYYI